jgi:hypothetical protein
MLIGIYVLILFIRLVLSMNQQEPALFGTFRAINARWSWLFSGNIQKWETESGSDRTFFTDGTVGLSRLNQVSWDSYALTTGVQYRF